MVKQQVHPSEMHYNGQWGGAVWPYRLSVVLTGMEEHGFPPSWIESKGDIYWNLEWQALYDSAIRRGEGNDCTWSIDGGHWRANWAISK